MLASRSHEGVIFLDLLSPSHSITSSLFSYLGSTDAPCSCLGDPAPPSPKWRPHSQGPRTLPYRDPEQVLGLIILKIWWLLFLLDSVVYNKDCNNHIVQLSAVLLHFWLCIDVLFSIWVVNINCVAFLPKKSARFCHFYQRVMCLYKWVLKHEDLGTKQWNICPKNILWTYLFAITVEGGTRK